MRCLPGRQVVRGLSTGHAGVGVLDRGSGTVYIRRMRSTDEQPKALEGGFYRELRLLEEVESGQDLSQRQIARQLGIALGVANLLVRRLARQGYIRVTHLSWKRWGYVLTPAGNTRKFQLTLAYIERFVQHYRRVRHLLREDIGSLPLGPESRVAIIGTTELAELAFLALKDLGVNDIDVFERHPDTPKFLGMRVRELASFVPDQYARVVIASSGDLGASLDELHVSGVCASQVVELLQPRLLGQAAGGRRKGSS